MALTQALQPGRNKKGAHRTAILRCRHYMCMQFESSAAHDYATCFAQEGNSSLRYWRPCAPARAWQDTRYQELAARRLHDEDRLIAGPASLPQEHCSACLAGYALPVRSSASRGAQPGPAGSGAGGRCPLLRLRCTLARVVQGASCQGMGCALTARTG